MTLGRVDEGNGPTIVLVHGWPVSAAMWRGQLDALSDEFRLLAVDLPGFGASPPAAPATISGLAQALEAFLAAEQVERALLVGWSMGAGVVMRYCDEIGCARLAGVGLVEDSPRLRPGPDWPAGIFTTFADDIVERWFAQWEDGGRRTVLEEMFTAGFHVPVARAAEIESLVLDGLAADPATALATFKDSIACDLRDGLSAISVPALLVYGRSSQMSTPAVHDFMRERIPGAQLHVFPESGHCPMLEERQAFNDLLRSFARRVLLADA
jgi:pimeloyl-ACP methyl ester carboxylesterase